MGRTNRGEWRKEGADVDVESLCRPWLHLRRCEEEESLEATSGGGGITNNAWGRLGTGVNRPLLDYTVPHTATTSDKQQYRYLLPSVIRLGYIWFEPNTVLILVLCLPVLLFCLLVSNQYDKMLALLALQYCIHQTLFFPPFTARTGRYSSFDIKQERLKEL